MHTHSHSHSHLHTHSYTHSHSHVHTHTHTHTHTHVHTLTHTHTHIRTHTHARTHTHTHAHTHAHTHTHHVSHWNLVFTPLTVQHYTNTPNADIGQSTTHSSHFAEVSHQRCFACLWLTFLPLDKNKVGERGTHTHSLLKLHTHTHTHVCVCVYKPPLCHSCPVVRCTCCQLSTLKSIVTLSVHGWSTD